MVQHAFEFIGYEPPSSGLEWAGGTRPDLAQAAAVHPQLESATRLRLRGNASRIGE